MTQRIAICLVALLVGAAVATALSRLRVRALFCLLTFFSFRAQRRAGRNLNQSAPGRAASLCVTAYLYDQSQLECDETAERTRALTICLGFRAIPHRGPSKGLSGIQETASAARDRGQGAHSSGGLTAGILGIRCGEGMGRTASRAGLSASGR